MTGRIPVIQGFNENDMQGESSRAKWNVNHSTVD